jgi:hypothetical protein
MASKGVCCAAQAAGDLGKPLVVTIHKKDGTLSQRCGVCEVRPSCSNAQKLVFAFRFLQSAACGLFGGSKCSPTAAGIAQYDSQVRAAATAGQSAFVESPLVPGPGATFTPYTPLNSTRPYTLPLS